MEKLRGMFAFAIWDERRRVLFGARDRLGIKPFYYYAGQRQFAFASELKSLLEIPGIPRDIDPASLGEFLRRRYVIAPHTMLQGIRKLEPGHTISVTESGVEVKRYWEVPLEQPSNIGEPEALEQAGALLEEALRMHLVADVPLGAFLSGGIDSSCVVGLMAKLGVSDIKTFSIGYDSAESELDYARIVANHFHTDHHELRLTPVAFRDILPRIVWYMDEPVGDTASIPLYFLSEFARRKVTVALSGEGSDELFGGYPIYRRMLGYETVNRLPFIRAAGNVLGKVAGDTKVGKYADMLGRPLEWRYGGVGGLFSGAQAARLYPDGDFQRDSVATAYEKCAHLPPLSRMSYIDLKTWLPDDLLVKADRMTMAHSLELRVPFLDHHLVEFAARLPRELKVRGNITKYLLKKWAEPLLPREISIAPKKDFRFRPNPGFAAILPASPAKRCWPTAALPRQFFSRTEIEQLLEIHQRENRSEQIYSLLVFEVWHNQFLRQLRRLPGRLKNLRGQAIAFRGLPQTAKTESSAPRRDCQRLVSTALASRRAAAADSSESRAISTTRFAFAVHRKPLPVIAALASCPMRRTLAGSLTSAFSASARLSASPGLKN